MVLVMKTQWTGKESVHMVQQERTGRVFVPQWYDQGHNVQHVCMQHPQQFASKRLAYRFDYIYIYQDDVLLCRC